MFRQDLKNNFKNKIIRNNKLISDMFDLIKVVIDFDNKLYKRVIKKQYNQLYKKVEILFELTTKY